MTRTTQETEGSAEQLTDPYLIAFLRGGPEEALRVATLGLLDRKLLSLEKSGGKVFLKAAENAFVSASNSLEREIVRVFRGTREATPALREILPGPALEVYQAELEARQLFPDDEAQRRRNGWLLTPGLFLGTVTLIKVIVGYSRGRPVSFLVILTAVILGIAYAVVHVRRTTFGDRTLEDLRTLFKQLRSQADWLRSQGSHAAMLCLAAVYGLRALPVATYPYLSDLYGLAAPIQVSQGGS